VRRPAAVDGDSKTLGLRTAAEQKESSREGFTAGVDRDHAVVVDVEEWIQGAVASTAGTAALNAVLAL
jgi:hypothetical protein